MTVKNHTATLLPLTLKTLHVMFPSTAKEVVSSVGSFSSKGLKSPCSHSPHSQEPGDQPQGSMSTSSSLLASVS